MSRDGNGGPYRSAAKLEETLAERRARFESLTSPHIEALYRTALRMTGRQDRAEDVVQDTYLRAWKYFGTFEQGRDPKVWLFAILRNAVFEASRLRKRQLGSASLDEIGADRVESASESPLEKLTDQDVLAAIDRLPEEFRMVVLLAVVEEMKYREIAEALAIPIGTVMSRLFRGRKLLRHHLRSYLEGKGRAETDAD